MRFSANVLRIQGQFLYMPGCMIVSFEDPECHTTEVKIVRSAQGVNLSKLKDAHDIYKEVVHDVIGADVGLLRLDELVKRKPLYGPWVVVGSYGLASGFVGPFAFGARIIDFPFSFLLGATVGFLQQVVAPKSDLYSNIVEISAAVLTSFIARGFGSIRGGQLFCFSAMAQSAIALILPGYAICEFFGSYLIFAWS